MKKYGNFIHSTSKAEQKIKLVVVVVDLASERVNSLDRKSENISFRRIAIKIKVKSICEIKSSQMK